MAAATPRAQADPSHPIFHVAAPAQWMNDPNGPISYKGYYHLFYQVDPFSDAGGPKYWGHVRSRDLAHWEPLPIALWPSTDAGESEVWSGCCTINGQGQPMIFYTSIAAGQSPQTHAEQWAAIGDDDLITWRKSPANPVLTEELHGGKKIYDWRDPFVFRERNQTFLVTGGNLNQAHGGQAVVNIYEAQNPALTQWKYRGVLFALPDGARTAECPNFFRLSKDWVLVASPFGNVHYYVGDFDPESCRFRMRAQGLVDFGRNFYAPNTMQLSDGQRIMWGWVTGFPGGQGWNGCLSVPRLLSVSKDGLLRQKPAPQLDKLNGQMVAWRDTRLDATAATFKLPATNALEILAEIDLKTAESVLLEFKNGAAGAPLVPIKFDGSNLNVLGSEIALPPNKSDRRLNLRIFMDRRVLEVFANETACATENIAPIDSNTTLEIRAIGGTAKANLIQAWPMNTIW